VLLCSRGWLAVLVLRALSLLVLADLSGLAHTALDLTGSAHEAYGEDCDGGGQDHECPPGCPNCHAGHAGLASPPLAREVVLEPAPALARVELPPPAYDRTQPRAPDQSALYRPPRALAVG
jgi:hypothetical protein